MSLATIRGIEVRDISAILRIQKDSKEAAQWSQTEYERLCDAPAGQPVWVAERENQVAGFLVARHIGSETEILNLAVDHAARRLGLGTQLLRQCLWEARKNAVEKIYLEVRASNQAAQAFYQAHGFAAAGIRRNYYTSPAEDAVLLSCLLSHSLTKKISNPVLAARRKL